jgi:signal peptidase I
VNPELDFEKRYRLIREIIETIVLTVLMFLVIRLAVQNFNVDGTSMEPNLHDKEFIVVDRWSYLFHPPTRGDVIVFVAPPAPDQDYVKRIIGVPGDVVTINNGVPTVNGVTIKEAYIDPLRMGAAFGERPVNNMVVPANKYFVMGDNRKGSYDSRSWGFLPRGNIIGRAALVYWPFGQDNYGLLPNVSSAFAKVPDPKPVQATGFMLTMPDVNVFDAQTLVFLVIPGLFLTSIRGRGRVMWRRRKEREKRLL